MTAIRSILAATDFSPDAVQAGQRAATQAAQLGAGLTLLHVLEPQGLTAMRDWLDGRDIRAAIAEQATMELAAHAGQLRQAHGIEVREDLRQGRGVAEVQAAAEAADVVVLGARGAHGLRDFMVGTTADRLARSARKPLLMVRNAVSGPYRKGLVLTDFSPAAGAALQAALALAPRAAIHLFHAFEVPFEGKLRLAGVSAGEIDACRDRARREAMEQLRALAASVGPARSVQTDTAMGDVFIEALRMIDSLQPDFIAVGKQGNSALEDFFLGSTTAHLLAHARCDVLVVPVAAQPADN